MKALLMCTTFLFIGADAAEVSIKLCETQSKGSSCNITCYSEGISGPVEFYKDASLRASCLKNNGKTTDSDMCIIPNVGSNETTLVIHSLMKSRDGGFWTCAVNGRASERKQLKIYDMPLPSVSSAVSQYGNRRKITLREGATTSLDVHLRCVYPKPEITVITDDPRCSVCGGNMTVIASGSTKCNTVEDEDSYNAACDMSWEALVRQEACTCQRKRLYAEVYFFNTSIIVDLNRELNVLDKTECGKLTGFMGIEILPLGTFFVSTVVLVFILCKTSYHYLEIQSSNEYEFVNQLR